MILNLIIRYFRSLIATDQQSLMNLALLCRDGINMNNTFLSVDRKQIFSKKIHL